MVISTKSGIHKLGSSSETILLLLIPTIALKKSMNPFSSLPPNCGLNSRVDIAL